MQKATCSQFDPDDPFIWHHICFAVHGHLPFKYNENKIMTYHITMRMQRHKHAHIIYAGDTSVYHQSAD